MLSENRLKAILLDTFYLHCIFHNMKRIGSLVCIFLVCNHHTYITIHTVCIVMYVWWPTIRIWFPDLGK